MPKYVYMRTSFLEQTGPIEQPKRMNLCLRGGPWFSELHELHPPVVGPPFRRGVRIDRLAVSEPPGLQSGFPDPLAREPRLHGRGPLLGKRLVDRLVPLVVGVAFDRELQVGVVVQNG